MTIFTRFYFAILGLALLTASGCKPSTGSSEDAMNVVSGPVVQSREIRYTVDGREYLGWIAWDSTSHEERPGILVVHEWWGHNDYARERARMLAEQGYTAFALDMFGEGKQAAHPEQAMEFVQEALNTAEAARGRFDKALEILKNQPTVNPERIGAIGYCFGGTVVLEMVRAGVALDAVATFHAGLGTEHPADTVRHTQLMVFTGADDPMVPPEAVESFNSEMKAAGAQCQLIAFPGAVHAFTNPGADSLGKKFGLPLAYNAMADSTSWKMASAFLADALKP